MVEIHEFGLDDEADTVRSLFTSVDPTSSVAAGVTDDEVAGFLDDPSAFLLGALVEGEPVGLAWGVHMRYPSGRLTTYLHQLDVREEHRRRGIGTALVSAAMDLGRRRGADRFWLSTGGHNEVAQAVYESLGGDRKPLGDVNYWWTLD
ncbi:MAG: GNAT family N-acetyltransferase [Actinomycetota bacterium]